MAFLDKVTDPATGQSLADIEQHLRSCAAGDLIAIRDTQGGMLTYKITEVTGTSPRGRLYTRHAGGSGGASWYMKHGKNAFHPKGQTRLFILTDAIRDYIVKHPNGALTYDIHVPD